MHSTVSDALVPKAHIRLDRLVILRIGNAKILTRLRIVGSADKIVSVVF